jgi:hypothetical protein
MGKRLNCSLLQTKRPLTTSRTLKKWDKVIPLRKGVPSSNQNSDSLLCSLHPQNSRILLHSRRSEKAHLLKGPSLNSKSLKN